MRSVGLHSHRLASDFDLTTPQLICLLKIAEREGPTIKELSEEVFLSPSTLVGIADRLESKGLIRRERSTLDRRRVALHATPEGRSVLERAPSPLQDSLARALNRLPELERTTIALSLERIVDLMEIGDVDASPILDAAPRLDSPAAPIPSDRDSESSASPPPEPVFREPDLDDGPAVHDLVLACPPLDPNSRYAYLLLCTHFRGTSVVAAEPGASPLAFVSAYIEPEAPETLFVWQVAVRPEARGRRLASRAILSILSREVCREVRFLETTISPSNEASRSAFRALARELGAEFRETERFAAHRFGDGAHEEERLVRIGPFAAPSPPRSPR